MIIICNLYIHNNNVLNNNKNKIVITIYGIFVGIQHNNNNI